MTGANDQPDVTVVTVTYNGAGLVAECLDGLARQELGDVRPTVVVVDNHSSDGTPEIVRRTHPEATLVETGANLGFAGANNLALRTVRSRYVVLLNNDAVPEPDFLRTLVEAMDTAPAEVAGMAATVLLADRFREAEPDERGAIQGPDGRWVHDASGPVSLVNSTGNEVRTDGFGIDRSWLANAATLDVPSDVFGISGAAAILRTQALHEVAGFDDRYFMYYEDTDLSWRLRLAGYRFEHCPAAVVHHRHAASSREGSELFRFHDARNRLVTVTKDATVGLALRVVLRYLLTTGSIAVRRSQPWPLVRTRLRAFSSYVALLPHALSERHRIGRAARVARSQVEEALVTPAARPLGGYRL